MICKVALFIIGFVISGNAFVALCCLRAGALSEPERLKYAE